MNLWIPDTFLTIQEQTRLFLWSVLLGVPLGCLLTLLRTCNRLLHPPAWIVSLGDIAFCIVWAAASVAFTSAFAGGQFRFFYLVGNLLGGILFLLTLGNPLLRLLLCCLRFLGKILRRLLRPWFRLVAWIRRKIHRKFVIFSKLSENMKNLLRFLLIAPRKMLYNICSSFKGKSGE